MSLSLPIHHFSVADEVVQPLIFDNKDWFYTDLEATFSAALASDMPLTNLVYWDFNTFL